MKFFQTFALWRRDSGTLLIRRPPRASEKSVPKVEPLEDRFLLTTCAVISGFVYHDANQNGLYDPGETPIANNTIQLQDTAHNVIASTVTDAQGAYSFSSDPRIDTTSKTLSYHLSFPTKATQWSANETLPQFDPSLGTLTSVDIQANTSITTFVRVENLDSAPELIHMTVSGSVSLAGPSFAPLSTPFSDDQSFSAAAFDGTIDFNGPSGKTFAPQTSTGTLNRTLTSAADLAPYIGTGSVTFTGAAQSADSHTGSGNLVLAVNTVAGADNVNVVYHYTPNNCLPAGNYLIVQPATPTGYLPGLKTAGNVTPIPNSVNMSFIPVTLGSSSLTNNNFGELKPASLAGFVYHDRNDNGVKEPGEEGIGNVNVTLSGIDDLGNPVNQVQATAADGSYHFGNLRPGTYVLTEIQPGGWLHGKDTIGTPGGVTASHQFRNIPLANGVDGMNNDFAELKPATLSGFVYLDPDNNGIKEPGETGIGGVMITLTGMDDQGTPITMVQTTAADGSYSFSGLRPGTYVITETHPNGFLDGKDTIGAQGGKTGALQFYDIPVTSGLIGTDNDFAELLPPTQVVPQQPQQQPPPPPPPPAPPAPPMIYGKQFFMGFRSLRA
jgi:hypothetical protein